MNEYYTKQTSQTFSVTSIAIISIFSSSCPFSAYNYEAVPAITNCSPSSNYDNFTIDSISPTYELNEKLQNENYPIVEKDEFGAVLANIFMELSSTQEPLGAEFEKVLFENIGELYQS